MPGESARIECDAMLTLDDQRRFDDDGYLVIEDVIGEDDLDGLRAEYTAILDDIAPRLVAKAKLTSTYGDLPFGERYAAMLRECTEMYDVYQHLDISLPLVEDLAPDAAMNTGPAVFGLLTHPQLLGIVESLIGPEIVSNPVQHTRIKPPGSATAGRGHGRQHRKDLVAPG